MKIHSLILVSALAIGIAGPAIGQSSTHRYVSFFKYADNAVKTMTENPQDRSAQAAKLSADFGGKMEAAYFSRQAVNTTSCCGTGSQKVERHQRTPLLIGAGGP
jgi:hypothetical protein